MLTGAQSAGTAPHAVVVGSPVAHSLSPALHRGAWQGLGLTGGRYDRVEVAAGGLAEALPALVRDGVTALSVTMPLKEEALEAGRRGAGASETAELAGGANTLVLGPEGWAADNTDVPALERVLARAAGGHPVREAVLLGSGATARSALLALQGAGVRSLQVGVRATVRPELGALAERLGVVHEAVPLDGALAEIAAGRSPRLVLSTLPATSWGALPVAGEWAPGAGARDTADPALVWVDAQYADWPHPWAGAAERAGATVVSGLHMLVEQAVDQVELMTGRRPGLADTASLLPEELRRLHRL